MFGVGFGTTPGKILLVSGVFIERDSQRTMNWGGRHGFEFGHKKKTSQQVMSTMSTKQKNKLIFLSGVDSFQD